MNMQNILIQAHKITKELKAEFPTIDYKAQLGITIAYLAQGGADMESVRESVQEVINTLQKDNTIYVCADNGIERSTDKAILVDGHFFPKSQCIYINNMDDTNYMVFIPLWLYRKKIYKYHNKTFTAEEIINDFVNCTNADNERIWDCKIYYGGNFLLDTENINL